MAEDRVSSARKELARRELEKRSGGKQAETNIPTIQAGKFPQQNILGRLFNASPQEQIAKAQNEYAISQTIGMPLKDVSRMNLTQQPQITGMMREPTTPELLQSQAQLYGSPALGAAMATSPIATIKGLVGGTIGYKLGEAIKPLERLTPESASQQTKEMAKTGDMLLSGILAYGGYKASSTLLNKMPEMGLGKYAKNKVLAIRKGALKEYGNMQEEYGRGLDELATNPQKVDPINMIGKMEETLNQRMPIQSNGKRIPAANKVDTALLKAYNRLSGKWANSKDGMVTVGNMIEELRLVKNSGGKEHSTLSRLATNIQKEILGTIKNDINVPKFQEMQAKYHQGMNELEALDKHFDIWNDNPYITAKGENFLKSGIFKSEEAKNISKLVSEKTGETLKGAKVISRTNQIVGSRILRYLLYAYGIREAGEIARNMGGNLPSNQ